MLKNAPTLAIVAVHTAENEPPKVYESPNYGNASIRKDHRRTLKYIRLLHFEITFKTKISHSKNQTLNNFEKKNKFENLKYILK